MFMPTFHNIKQADDRHFARLTWTQRNYDYGPNQTLVNPRLVISEQKSTSRIGKQRVTLYNKTKHWRPGRFSVSPIDQRSIVSTCTSGTLELFQLYAGKTYPTHTISGELGAWLGVPTAGSISVPAIEYPDIGMRLLSDATASASQADFEGMVMIGELKETFQMFMNPMMGLLTLLKKNPVRHRQGRGMSMRKVGKYLSDWWLQMRFGVMPFINDIAALRDAAETKMRREYSPIMHSRAVTTSQSESREGYTGTIFNVPVWGDTYARTRGRIMACVYYNRFTWSKLERMGLDWSQIPGAIWELVPFSFLVDRVVNVGEWLEICRPKQDFTILGSTLSYKVESIRGFHAKQAILLTPSTKRVTIDHLCQTTGTNYLRTLPGPLPSGPAVNLKLGGLIKTLDHLTLLNQNILNKIR